MLSILAEKNCAEFSTAAVADLHSFMHDSKFFQLFLSHVISFYYLWFLSLTNLSDFQELSMFKVQHECTTFAHFCV